MYDKQKLAVYLNKSVSSENMSVKKFRIDIKSSAQKNIQHFLSLPGNRVQNKNALFRA